MRETNLHQEGILVVGIQLPDGSYIGAPRGTPVVRPGDVVLLSGRMAVFSELDSRHAGGAGEQTHQNAIAGHQQLLLERDCRRQTGSHRRNAAK